MATHQDRFFLSNDWKQWVAENVLKGGAPEDLQRILVENGFNADLARLEIDVACQHPYLEAAKSITRQLDKRDWVLHTQRQLGQCGSGGVERRESLSTEEFLEEYYCRNRPVIITDVVNRWPAMTRWTPDYLKDMCRESIVEVQANRTSDARFELQPEKHRTTVPFEDFVDQCAGAASNDAYMTARNSGANGHVLAALRGDIDDIPEYLNPSGTESSFFLWFGPKGTITPLHHDLTNNFMAQVVGSKRIRLIAPSSLPMIYNSFHCYSDVDAANPNHAEYPQFADAQHYDITIGPGDLFFLPVGWWHHVEAVEMSITITCTNFRWNNDFTEFYRTPGEI